MVEVIRSIISESWDEVLNGDTGAAATTTHLTDRQRYCWLPGLLCISAGPGRPIASRFLINVLLLILDTPSMSYYDQFFHVFCISLDAFHLRELFVNYTVMHYCNS